MANENIHTRARKVAHEFTPRCRGDEPIGDDGIRYHSRACDDLTDTIVSFALSEMAILNSALVETREVTS